MRSQLGVFRASGGPTATGGSPAVGSASGASPPPSPSLGAATASAIDVEARLGIVKRNRGASTGGAGGAAGGGAFSVPPAPLPPAAPPCEHYPAFDTTTPLSATSVAVVRQLAAEMIDCLWFPDTVGQ